MKSQADKHRSKRFFQIGDRVFLKLQPYRQTSVSSMPNPKLAPKLYGPFKIVDIVGKVAYKLELLASALIHDVFHVLQLKKAYGYNGQFIPLPIQGGAKTKFSPLTILERKLVRRGNRLDVQLLIH